MKHPFKEGDPAIVISTTNPRLFENVGKVVTFICWLDEDDPRFDCVIQGTDMVGVERWTRKLTRHSGPGRSHSSRLAPLTDDNNDFESEVVDEELVVV